MAATVFVPVVFATAEEANLALEEVPIQTSMMPEPIASQSQILSLLGAYDDDDEEDKQQLESGP
jgi:hypothetical protein